MHKIYKIILIIYFLSLTFSSYAHVQHYKDLKKIEFDIFRNNKHIGTHIFSFKNEDGKTIVDSEINFKIKKLGVVFYRYNVKGTEIYENDKLVKFNSKTNQNGKEKYVNLAIEDDEYIIDGSSYKGKAPADFLIGTWWNHSIIDSKAQISAVSGRIIKQKVTFLGKELVNFNGKTYNALHFNFSSTDAKLNKNKKLDTDIWYDDKTLSWIKASFKKKGNWEYKLNNIQ